jgi:transcriptional regulator with XRE-family HTH domain
MPELMPDRCRRWREAVGLSIADLAQEAGVQPRAIEMFETGKGNLNAEGKYRVMMVLSAAGLEFSADPPKPQPPAVEILRPWSCKAMRRVHKWTPEELSRQTGGAITPKAIEQYEAGQNPLRPEARLAIAKAFEKTGLAIPTSSPNPFDLASGGVLIWVVLGVVFWAAVFGAIWSLAER